MKNENNIIEKELLKVETMKREVIMKTKEEVKNDIINVLEEKSKNEDLRWYVRSIIWNRDEEEDIMLEHYVDKIFEDKEEANYSYYETIVECAAFEIIKKEVSECWSIEELCDRIYDSLYEVYGDEDDYEDENMYRFDDTKVKEYVNDYITKHYEYEIDNYVFDMCETIKEMDGCWYDPIVNDVYENIKNTIDKLSE